MGGGEGRGVVLLRFGLGFGEGVLGIQIVIEVVYCLGDCET